MPHVVTPFLVTVRAGEQLPLRLLGESHAPPFAAALHTVVFTRRLEKGASASATLSLVVHCNTADGGSCSFTIASHKFGTLVDDVAAGGEDAVAVQLRSPIVFTSRGLSRALEVKCATRERAADAACRPLGGQDGAASDSAAYAVTMHGTQQTVLTHEQVELLCRSHGETKPRNGTVARTR